jgi:prepilin-type N-terminal cleavage/methylation domain-containing protein
MKNNKKSGFSAVELLVTLFIAAMFLVAGYQLYSLVIGDGGKTRSHAKASNVVYDYLKRYESFVSNPCIASTPVNNDNITVENLENVTMMVAITCPYPANTSISKVTATINYNDGEVLTEANYVNSKNQQ